MITSSPFIALMTPSVKRNPAYAIDRVAEPDPALAATTCTDNTDEGVKVPCEA